MTGPQVDTSSILLGIIIILAAASVGEFWAVRLGMPQVLGELCMGVLLGNLYLIGGWKFFDSIGEMPFLRVLGDIGAIILLLTVGLHTDFKAIVRVGLSSLLVGLVGIVAPATLGFLTCQVMIPEASMYAKLFLVAALCVNSVGIAIRVFTESGKLDTPEARIVMAATLLDAILIFFMVGVLSGIVQVGHIDARVALARGGLASFFLIFVGVVSLRYGQEIGDFVTRRFPESIKVVVTVIVCLFMACLAVAIGMSPIVGAFGAGLLMRDIRSRDPGGTEWSMEEMIRPAYCVLVPVFFVFLGMRIKLENFLDKEAVLLGLVVTAVAVLGKLMAGLGVRENGVNRLWVGVGMVPRAEMTLIVASMGMAVNALDPMTYSAIVAMAVFTSLFGLPFLRRLLYSP